MVLGSGEGGEIEFFCHTQSIQQLLLPSAIAHAPVFLLVPCY